MVTRYNCFYWAFALVFFLGLSTGPVVAQPEAGSLPEGMLLRDSSQRLAELFPVIDADISLQTITTAMPAMAKHFSSGWNRVRQNQDPEKVHAWTKGRRAVLEIPIVMPADRELQLVVSPPEEPQKRPDFGTALPVIEAEFWWNGVSLGRAAVPETGTELRFEVPAELQRFGPNRLEIHNTYWLVPAKLGISEDARNRGIGLKSLTLSPVDYEIRAPEPGVVVEDVIVQKPGSVLSWYLEVPAHGELTGTGRLEGLDAATAEQYDGQVTLALTHDDGEQEEVVTIPFRDLGANPEIPVALDLADYAGEMIGLSLSFWIASSDADARIRAAEAATIQWEGLRLEGRQPTIDRAALERGLEELRGQYNVFVILFDTLRADYTDTYGGKITASTPHLSALAKTGVLFEDCSSNSSWTRTSVSSIFSSLTPQTHGVLGSRAALPESLPNFPEMLRERGYKTLFMSNNAIVPPSLGFDRGFDEYFQLYSLRTKGELDGLDTPEKMASYVWEESIAPFIDAAGDDPFFVYLHEIDPHAPWDPVPPFGEMYDYNYNTTLKCEREVANMLRNQSLPLSSEDLRNFQAGYRAEISFMDGYLGTLREKLQEADLEKDTIVLFISDHGEEFLEHGLIGHYWSQYEESLRVPMVWSLPGKIPASKRVGAHAQLIDIPPTLFDLLGMPIPALFEGRSLLPFFLLPEDAEVPNACFGATRGNWRWSVRLGKEKLCKHRAGTIGVQAQQYEYLLFDLETDPDEQFNRWADKLTTGKGLRQLLAWREHTGELADFEVEEVDADADMTPEEQDDLEALGYL